MSIEEIPSDKKVKMTAFWHKAFNIAGCDPKCHCCHSMIKTGMYFELATVLKAPSDGNCLHYYKDITELQIKAIKKEEITLPDIEYLKESNYYFDADFKKKGGLKGIIKLAQPDTKEVMLCSKCTADDFSKRQIAILEGRIIERDKPKGGCFRVNGKIII